MGHHQAFYPGQAIFWHTENIGESSFILIIDTVLPHKPNKHQKAQKRWLSSFEHTFNMASQHLLQGPFKQSPLKESNLPRIFHERDV